MYTYFVQGQEIRHILMHLIKPGQARFSYRDQDYFWDSVAIGLVDISTMDAIRTSCFYKWQPHSCKALSEKNLFFIHTN